jgi:SAM-dependent methyltransferase
MSIPYTKSVKILVALANYGTANDQYVSRLIAEYRSMPYRVDIVVFTNVHKHLGADIEVVVGLPSKEPRTLPFSHKQLFSKRVDDYDLFIYSEDDTLITVKNIEAFLRLSTVLPDNEVAGFLRFEEHYNGNMSYPDVHGHYHWDSESVRCRGGYTFAFFTNEHAACYILTREQLRRAIRSGGFMVAPHQGKYDLQCTAATDPYTQCGSRKLICVSHFSDFLVHHLSNKYAGVLGLEARYFDCQIQALLQIAAGRTTCPPLIEIPLGGKASPFENNYYEPIREDLINLIPASARTVLSFGCGWGATEEKLVQGGRRVIAAGLDPVISACAQERGVEILDGQLNDALKRLPAESLDCLLISNVLHLLRDPGGILRALSPCLSKGGIAIIAVPNLQRLSVVWRRLNGVEAYRFVGTYERSGVQATSRRRVRQWLKGGGLRVGRFVDVLPERARTLCRATFGLVTPLVASEIVVVAEKIYAEIDRETGSKLASVAQECNDVVQDTCIVDVN